MTKGIAVLTSLAAALDKLVGRLRFQYIERNARTDTRKKHFLIFSALKRQMDSSDDHLRTARGLSALTAKEPSFSGSSALARKRINVGQSPQSLFRKRKRPPNRPAPSSRA
jgi:hypothetical protein